MLPFAHREFGASVRHLLPITPLPHFFTGAPIRTSGKDDSRNNDGEFSRVADQQANQKRLQALLILTIATGIRATDTGLGSQTGPWSLPTSNDVIPVADKYMDCDTALHYCMLDRDCSRAYGNTRAMCNQDPEDNNPARQEPDCSAACRDSIYIMSQTRLGTDYLWCDCGDSQLCNFKRRELQKCT